MPPGSRRRAGQGPGSGRRRAGRPCRAPVRPAGRPLRCRGRFVLRAGRGSSWVRPGASGSLSGLVRCPWLLVNAPSAAVSPGRDPRFDPSFQAARSRPRSTRRPPGSRGRRRGPWRPVRGPMAKWQTVNGHRRLDSSGERTAGVEVEDGLLYILLCQVSIDGDGRGGSGAGRSDHWARGSATFPAAQTPGTLIRPVASTRGKPAPSSSQPRSARRPSV